MFKRWGAVAAIVMAVTALTPNRADAVLAVGIGPDNTPNTCVATGDYSKPRADDRTLKVATFNALHSETDEGDRTLGDRIPLIADAIAKSGADIIGLQEVTENYDYNAKSEYPQKHGQVYVRIAEQLSRITGESWTSCFTPSNPHAPTLIDTDLDQVMRATGNLPDQGDFSEGLAILTRYYVQDAKWRRMLPRSYEAAACVNLDPFCNLTAAFDARQIFWMRVKTPQDGSVDVFNTHLAHNITPLSKLTQQLMARQAIAFIDRYAKADRNPDVFLGDFNSAPKSAVIRTLAAAGFADTYATSGGPECVKRGDAACSGGPVDGQESFTKTPTRTMGGRIDYLLARAPKGCALRVPDSHTIGTTPAKQKDGRYLWASDHVGFVSTIACAY